MSTLPGGRPNGASAPRRRTTHYEPNTTEWQPGDLVIHDDDAKRPDMLMVVLGRTRAGIYRTRYAFPDQQPKSWRKKIWRNTEESLHDPRRFGITLRGDLAAPLNVNAVEKGYAAGRHERVGER
jgi:hypothetical protein